MNNFVMYANTRCLVDKTTPRTQQAMKIFAEKNHVKITDEQARGLVKRASIKPWCGRRDILVWLNRMR